MAHTGSRSWVARALSRGAHREEREYAKDYIKGKAGVNNEVGAMCSRTCTGLDLIKKIVNLNRKKGFIRRSA